MLYLDTFGSFGGVGRCSVELLPPLAQRLGRVTVTGESHVIDSYAGVVPASPQLHFRNLSRPLLHPRAWRLRRLAKRQEISATFTDALLARALENAPAGTPLLINYPQDHAPPGGKYAFDIFLHDLNWRRFPESSSSVAARDTRCQEWVRQARRVFTNSEFTRDEILELYGTAPGKVVAAPLAPPTLPPAGNENDDAAQLATWGLRPRGYFFLPSIIARHKGHEVLADALETAPSNVLPIVITASIKEADHATPGNFSAAAATRLRRLQGAGRIVSLPYLPWAHVLLLARNCRAYVLPSRFEGFGFPLVEALALGKPTICSDIPAFREIIARYGPLLRAETFPAGNAGALRNLLVVASEFPASEFPPPDLSRSWSWHDTAKAIARSL